MVTARWIGMFVGLCLAAHAPSAHARDENERVENTYDRSGRLAKPKPPPAQLKATVGKRPPDGYRVERRPRTGLLIAGLATTFLGGLFIAQAATTGGDIQVMYVPGGMCVLAGLPLLAIGMFDEKTVWVRTSPRLELTAVVGLGHAGGSARFRF